MDDIPGRVSKTEEACLMDFDVEDMAKETMGQFMDYDTGKCQYRYEPSWNQNVSFTGLLSFPIFVICKYGFSHELLL